MPAPLTPEIEVDAPADASGWACDFTCPVHGEVTEVVEAVRGGRTVYLHAGCGLQVQEDWW